MYIDIKSTWLVPNSGNQSMDSSPSKSLKVILDVDFHGVFPFVRNAKLQAANQHIGWVSESPNYEPFFWANYGGLSGGQPKWWFSRGMLPKPKSPWFRFRKYSSFSQIFSFEQVRAMTFWPMILLKLLLPAFAAPCCGSGIQESGIWHVKKEQLPLNTTKSEVIRWSQHVIWRFLFDSTWNVASICWFWWSTFPSLRCHVTIPLSDDDVSDRPKLIFIALIGFSKALSWVATWKRSFCLGVEKLVQWENYICDMFTLRSL